MSSVVSLIRSAELFAGVPYAYAATAPAGSRLIFLAGACPLDAAGAVVSPGNVTAQTSRALANMKLALAAAGASIGDVITTRVLVASSDQSDLVAAWNVVHETFGEHDVPSTLLGVTVLGWQGQLVEIEAVAAVAPGPDPT